MHFYGILDKKFFVTDIDDELGIGAEGSQNIYGAVPSSIRGRGGRGFSIAGLRRHGPGKVLDQGSAWQTVASRPRSARAVPEDRIVLDQVVQSDALESVRGTQGSPGTDEVDPDGTQDGHLYDAYVAEVLGQFDLIQAEAKGNGRETTGEKHVVVWHSRGP